MHDTEGAPSLLELYEHAPCGYLVTQPDGTLIRVNQTFLELTGYARGALEGARRFQDLLPPGPRAFYENQFAPLLRMQGFVKEVALELLTQAGERVPVLVNAVQRLDAAGRPMASALAIFEATDRRAYERELLEARRKAEVLAAVVTASHDAILTVDADGVIQTWNPAAESLFGRSSRDMSGGPVAKLIPVLGEQTEWQRIAAELLGDRAVIVEAQAVGPDGPIEISVSLAPHLGYTGELAAISLIIRDSRERHALERQKDEFLATVSHDLKNPVAVIKGFAQLLMRRTRRLPATEGERWRNDLATVDATAGQLNAMIDELLDLSQVQLGRPLELHLESVDLVALAKRASQEHQQHSQAHTIVVQTDLEKVEGRWDRARLERIIGNLLSNAIKYSPDGGRITVTIGREAHAAGDIAVLGVRDTGIGIPPADLPRIFDRFYRGRNVTDHIAGTGIGLAGAKQLVEQHGGNIHVESSVGVGTIFIVRLPLDALVHDRS